MTVLPQNGEIVSGIGPASPWAEHWLHLSYALLSVATGLIDAVSFLALGRVFTANMTGNVVLLGFAAAHVPGLSVGRSLTALAFAGLGGVVAGRLEGSQRPRSKRRWLTIVGSVETLVLLVATLVAFFFTAKGLPSSVGLLLIALTALSMGIRNGTVRHLGVPDITTTVLTLTVAGLASESSLAGGANPHWRRRVTAIAAMLCGAFVGAALLRISLAAPLAATVVLNALATALQRKFGKDSMEGRQEPRNETVQTLSLRDKLRPKSVGTSDVAVAEGAPGGLGGGVQERPVRCSGLLVLSGAMLLYEAVLYGARGLVHFF